MFHWAQRLQHRLRWRKVTTAALTVVQAGEGFAVHTWPISDSEPPELHTQRLNEAVRWLREQLGVAATPYGWSNCSVLLALAQVEQNRRTLLWKAVLPSFPKAEGEQGLAAAEAALVTVPMAMHPTTTQLEVYLMDLGGILKRAVDHAEGS